MRRTALTLIFLMSLLGLAQESLRILPHVPPPRTLFDTWVYLGNQSDAPQTYELLGFLMDGTPLPLAAGQLEPGEVRRLKSTDLFENAAPSHFLARGEIDVTLEYRSPFSERLSLFLPEQTQAGDRFRLYCQSFEDDFVGLVVVNLGTSPASVHLQLTDFGGEVQKEETVVENLPVLGKTIFTLSQILGEDMPASGCSLTLEADQPIILQLFKGRLPVRNDGTLDVLIPAVTRTAVPTATPWDN